MDLFHGIVLPEQKGARLKDLFLPGHSAAAARGKETCTFGQHRPFTIALV
jgi:hypothetical protein